MKITLITSTLNRHNELQKLLGSLVAQTRRPDQIIIVDQSGNDLSGKVIEEFKSFLPIFYVKQDARGLSRGRNEGWKYASGDLVAFPDDDCIYPPDTIDKVFTAFEHDRELGILTGMSISEFGQPSQGRWARTAHLIDQYNVWVSQTSFTTFYRYSVLERLGGFDETLGVGSETKWGAGEDTELILRALKAGAKGQYDNQLRIIHRDSFVTYDDAALLRGKRYNRGFGRVLRLNDYPLWFVAYMIIRPMIGALTSWLRLRRSEARYRLIASSQRALGWLDRD